MSWNVDDFFTNLFNKKLFVRLPENGDDNLTAASKLLDIRREISEMEQALAAQKDEFQMKMDNLQRRREDLQRREYQLKESLLKFDKFIKDNDAKKQRAIKRQSGERESRVSKEREIEMLRESITVMDSRREVMAGRARKYNRYHTFLEKAIETSREFSEIRELMGRFDTLVSTHESLLTSDQENQGKIQSEKQLLSQYIEEKLNEKLRATALLSELQDQRDLLESECHRLETAWLQIQNNAAAKTMVLGSIKMATYNLYQHIQKIHADHKHEVSRRSSQDTVGQLHDIQRCIQDLTDIANHAKQLVLEDYIHSSQQNTNSQVQIDAMQSAGSKLTRDDLLPKSSKVRV